MHSSTVNGIPTLGDAINTARMRAGLSDQDLAYAQGILPSLWSRQLHGQGHIALDRLAHTPLAFRVELIGQLETLWGVETTLETIYRELSGLRLDIQKARAGMALKAHTNLAVDWERSAKASGVPAQGQPSPSLSEKNARG